MERSSIIKHLRAQVDVNGHFVGAAVGAGMSAKFITMGGADFLMALSAGKYRVMGRSSFASYLCYGNSNDLVMELGTRELLPIMKESPVLFGLFASDPDIHLYDYLKDVKKKGFSGITNFPTISLIDGKFREALEEEGNVYDLEVEAIKIAHYLDLFTVAFVTTEEETYKMIKAGADMICVHLGLTRGGYLGAKNTMPLFDAKSIADKIFKICEEENPDIFRAIYAGSASTPIDMQYIYQNTSCQGYVGGSTFERIPAERAIYNTTKAFKCYNSLSDENYVVKMINGNWNTGDYTEFIKRYIADNYMKKIQINELAMITHVTPSYLSTKFKKDTGTSFTDYLVEFRMNKAKQFLEEGKMKCGEVAESVGYQDYVQFTKLFKKKVNMTPQEFIKSKTMK